MKCKTCNKLWAKNETQMQEHYNYCKLKNSGNSNISSSTSSFVHNDDNNTRTINHKQQTKMGNFLYKFMNADQKELESLLAHGFYSAEYSDLNTVINYLLNETQFLYLVTDGWSNIRKDSIINFMITTPKPLFYKSVHTKEDQYTAQNIAEGIDKVMQELGINKFVAVITDNTPNMKAAWHILKNQYLTKVFLECWAHGINLWIKDILKLDWPKNVLETSKEIINYFRNHNIPLAALQESIGISPNIKIYLMNDLFWQNLKHLRNFLEPFVKFIHELEGDVPLLSAAFLKLCQLETTICNNDYVPTIVITESIRLVEQRWNDFLYNPATMDALIERELICFARPENKDQVLEALSEYVGKTGGFSDNYLLKEKLYNWWNLVKARYLVLSGIVLKLFSIPAISASSEHNWSSFNFVHSKLRNRLHNSRVKKIVYIYWNLQILCSLNWPLSVKKLRNRSYLIEDNIVNLELNETNSVEENNIDDSLSDSLLYINSMDYADEIDDMDINKHIDDLDSIDNMINIDNMDNMDNIDSINDMSNDEK
ncbi:39957_t:CDS:2 [Gigaspora margarita]|uniref:39957_t:CDS:1 n=1 Tax=Gigaspora margarita TaxID=4874 RepID=A0ABN7V2J9_GIGMA|nr:39957_t:CDS:2 [Gigaspora margarita]